MSNQSPEHEGLPTAGVDDVQADPADSPLTAIEKARAIIAGHADNAQAHRLLAAKLRGLGRQQEAARADGDARHEYARSQPQHEEHSAMPPRQVVRGGRPEGETRRDGA